LFIARTWTSALARLTITSPRGTIELKFSDLDWNFEKVLADSIAYQDYVRNSHGKFNELIKE